VRRGDHLRAFGKGCLPWYYDMHRSSISVALHWHD
jgi:hypothetical protein